MMKRTIIKIIVIASVLLLTLCVLTACGKKWTCDTCGKNFSGVAYYGWYYEDTMCEDCARDYWMPLPYQNYTKTK